MKKILFLIILFFVVNLNAELSYFDIGVLNLLKEDYKTAELMFKKSYFSDEDFDSLLFLANAYFLNGKYKLANECYKKLLNDTKYLSDEQFKSFVKFMYAESFVYLENYNNAIIMYDELLKEKIQKYLLPYVIYGKVFCFYKLGDYNSVLTNVSIFKNLVKNDISEVIKEQIDYILADSWYRKSDFKNAEREFKNFISLHKDSNLSIYANIKLSEIYKEQKKFKDAEILLKSFDINKISEDVSVILKYNLAKVLISQNKFSEALEVYSEIYDKIQNNQKFLEHIEIDRAYCYYRLSKFKEAEHIFLNLTSATKDDIIKQNSMYLLGLNYFNNSKFSDAVDIFSKLLEQFSSETKFYDDALFYLGMSYLNNKQYKKAIQTFSQFKTHKTSIYYILSQLYLARCYKYLKEYETAKYILKQLSKKGISEDIELQFLYELAECYKLSCDYQTALEYYSNIIDRTKDKNLSIYSKISVAEIYNRLGRYKDAEDVLNNVLLQKDLTTKVKVNANLILFSVEYNLGNKSLVEKIAGELVENKDTPIDKKVDILLTLSNMYEKDKEYYKSISCLQQVRNLYGDRKDLFFIDEKIVKLLFEIKDFKQLSKELYNLFKKYSSNDKQMLVNYYYLKYCSLTKDSDRIEFYLSKLKSFNVKDFDILDKEKIYEILSICFENGNSDIVLYLSGNILPYLKNLNVKEKIDVLAKVADYNISRNNYEEVLKLAKIIKNLAPFDQNVTSYSEFLTGRIYELMGKMKLAENVYLNILEKYPSYQYKIKIYLSLISYYNSQNDFEKGKFYEERLLSEYPEDEETYKYMFNKAISLKQKGSFEEAIKVFSYVINTKDKDLQSSAQKMLAECYYNLGKYKEAAVEYLKVVYLYPDKTNLAAEAQYMVGVCAEKMKLYDEAKKAYKNSKEKYPNTLWAQEAEIRLKQMR